MQLIITQQNLGLWAAECICQRFQQSRKRPFVLGLPTGATVEDMYAALCSLAQYKRLDFSQIETFNMDEYRGLSAQHPQSYAYYMQQHLFEHIAIPPQQIHLLNGQATDLTHECAAYEQAIKKAGGIDLFLGGVGRNGHLAFNEPHSSLQSRTRLIDLTDSTRQANARFFGNDPTQVPPQALTVGIGTILDAKELLFLASGTAKAEAVARLTNGCISPLYPITALHKHPRATLLIDPAAAQALPDKTQAGMHAFFEKHPQQDFILSLSEIVYD